MKKLLGGSFALLSALLLLAYFFSEKKSTQKFSFINDSSKTLNLDDDYLSFALDMAQVLGGKWWEGSADYVAGRGAINAVPFDFNRIKLSQLVSPLEPFVLRLGGSEADSVFYAVDSNKTVLTDFEKQKGFQTILNKERIHSIRSFVNKHSLELLLTLNVGPGYRDHQGNLEISKISNFLKQLKNIMPHLKYFELGNEPNAFFLNYGFKFQINSQAYINEYKAIKKSLLNVFPDSKLMGPANAFWPVWGEVFKEFTNYFTVTTPKVMKELGESLDIMSWHYYPTQSHRCPAQLRPATKQNMLNAIERFDYRRVAQKIYSDKKKYNVPELWMGESGPAQCGGEPGVSTSFESALWFFDYLFKNRLYGNTKLVRQTLVGSDYGLIQENSLKLNYDYFIARLFKKLELKTLFDSPESKRSHVYKLCDSSQRLLYVSSNLYDDQIAYSEELEFLILKEDDFNSFSHENFDKKTELVQNHEYLRNGRLNLPKLSVVVLRSKFKSKSCFNELN